MKVWLLILIFAGGEIDQAFVDQALCMAAPVAHVRGDFSVELLDGSRVVPETVLCVHGTLETLGEPEL